MGKKIELIYNNRLPVNEGVEHVHKECNTLITKP